jgi:Transglycosylase-like domain
VLRTTLTVTLAVVLFALVAIPASAKNTTLCFKAHGVREAVVKKHGADAAGRNICRYGVQSKYNKRWTKPASTKLKARYLRQLRKLNSPPPQPQLLDRTAVPPEQPPAGVHTASVEAPAGGALESIAACESGGDPTAVSADGTYRGKYQFDHQTWASVGGSGDPAAAPEAEQDRRAAALMAQRGSSPWPVCGG